MIPIVSALCWLHLEASDICCKASKTGITCAFVCVWKCVFVCTEDETLDESLFSKQILSASHSLLCPWSHLCVCLFVCVHAYPAPHRPILLGVPLLPGADRCFVPGDGGLPLPWPRPLHALCGDRRWAHPSVDAAEFGLCWTCSFCKSIWYTCEDHLGCLFPVLPSPRVTSDQFMDLHWIVYKNIHPSIHSIHPSIHHTTMLHAIL